MLSLPMMISLILAQPVSSFHVFTGESIVTVCSPISALTPSTSAVRPVTTEYDEVLENWQKGKQLSLKHDLFQLNRVHSGDGTAHQIVFAGESFGEEGEITITFYTLDGDLVYVPSNHIRTAHVDRQRTNFSVGAIIPTHLRGRTGAIQITFNGRNKASFLVKVTF